MTRRRSSFTYTHTYERMKDLLQRGEILLKQNANVKKAVKASLIQE